jgi:hypothetical protein
MKKKIIVKIKKPKKVKKNKNQVKADEIREKMRFVAHDPEQYEKYQNEIIELGKK